MSGRGTWLGLLGVLALLAGLVFLGATRQASSPDHASTSDAADGTSALRAFAASLRHPVSALSGTFTLARRPGMLFVFSPDQPFTSDEASQVAAWIGSGGILVYSSEQADQKLEMRLGLIRSPQPTLGNGTGVGPSLPGVGDVVGAATVTAIQAQPDQAVLIRSATGDPLAVRQWVGSGQVIWLADPLELCNGYLGRADNGRLAADLLALGGPSLPVVFDEFHHNLFGGAGATNAWLLTPWGLGLIWALVIAFAGLAWHARRFGPRLPRQPPARRPVTEHALALGRLLRRARARRLTVERLQATTAQALATRAGLRLHPGTDLAPLLVARHPDLAQLWTDALGSAARADGSDANLLEAARRLRELAYPIEAPPPIRSPFKEPSAP